MKTLFVHRLLPMPGEGFDPRAHYYTGPLEDVLHVSRSFGPEALRGVALAGVRFVDVDARDLSVDRLDAIFAAIAAAPTVIDGRRLVPELKTSEMDFGDAVRALKAGRRVARRGWNGKGMHLEMQTPDAHSKMSLPYVFMFTACKNRVPWLASQTDILAEDWEILAEEEKPGPWYKPLPPELDPSLMAYGQVSAEKMAGVIGLEPDPLVEGAEIAVRTIRVGDITGTRMTVFADQEVSPEAVQALRLIFAE